MAIGSITDPKLRGRATEFVDGGRRTHVRDVQLTSGANYTTGGESITAKKVRLDRIEEVILEGAACTANGSASRAVAVLYQADGSVKLAVSNGGAEVAAGTDLSTYKVRARFVGKVAA